MRSCLTRLESNRDFKKLIADGYLKDEAVRLVHLKADPSMQTPDRQAAIDRDISGIGALLQYFRTVDFMAGQAIKSIEADEATREEVLAEGNEA